MNMDKFIEQETVTGVVPMMTRDRQYSFWDLFLTTSGFSIATWCYTQGAYVAQYLGFKQMIVNIFCFNLIWVLIECLPILFAVRYGIDLWIWLRATLGKKGVAIFATIISLANFGWYAVAAGLFASSMVNLVQILGVSIESSWAKPFLGVLCVVIGCLIALGGPAVIKWTNRFLVIILLIVGVIVVGLSFTAVPISEILAAKPNVSPGTSNLMNFMISAEGNVAFAFSWSTQALILPRLAGTERSGYWATSLAYGVVAPFFVFAGGVMALEMFVMTGVYESDPTTMLATLCGSAFGLLSLLLVAFANIGTQGTGSYVNCMIIKSGLPTLSYRSLVIITGIYVTILTVWGGVEEHFGAFISIAAFFQAPIIGMSFADYFLVRRRKLSLKSAYFLNGHHAYDYTGGFNVIGILSIIIACVTTITCVYNPLTGEVKSSLFLLFTGSGFDAILGGLLYYLASLVPCLNKYMVKDRHDLEIV